MEKTNKKFSISEVLNLLLVLAIIVIVVFQNRPIQPTEIVSSAVVDKESIVLENIFERKSVRKYTGQKISKEDMIMLMKAGMAAPSARNAQPWELVAVTDMELIKKLEEVLPYAKMSVNAGQGIVVCGDINQALPGGSSEFWIQDCAAVTQNILLAAEAMGLGAVWTGAYPDSTRSKVIRDILGLPENLKPLCYIPIGYPTGVEKPKDKFKEEKMHWNGF